MEDKEKDYEETTDTAAGDEQQGQTDAGGPGRIGGGAGDDGDTSDADPPIIISG